jgi:hypothetical protein
MFKTKTKKRLIKALEVIQILELELNHMRHELGQYELVCGQCDDVWSKRCPDCFAHLIEAEFGLTSEAFKSDESESGVICGNECGYEEVGVEIDNQMLEPLRYTDSWFKEKQRETVRLAKKHHEQRISRFQKWLKE